MKETREEIERRLAEIEAREKARTQGGWVADGRGFVRGCASHETGTGWLVSTVRDLLAENERLHADLRRLDPHYGQSPEDREAEFSEHLWAALGGGGEAPKRRPLA